MIGFGNFGKRTMEITTLRDERLMLVDTTEEHFYDTVLMYKTENKSIKLFQQSIEEVKDEGIQPFWRPVFDPSIDEESGKIIFTKGAKPAVRDSFDDWKNWWENETKKMPKVMMGDEYLEWSVGTDYQYYAFLANLINTITKSGWDLEEAMREVVMISSKVIWNSIEDFPKTGNYEICGCYDLGTTYKILRPYNKKIGWHCIAGRLDHYDTWHKSLAELTYTRDDDCIVLYATGWLVLS